QVPAGGTIPVDPLGWPAPVVGIDSATGRFLMVVRSSSTLTGHGFEADGSPAGPAFGISSLGFDPAVVGGRDGTFFVTWSASPQDGIYNDVYGAGVDASGGVRVPPFPLATSTNAGRDSPRPVQLSTGDYVAIWTSGTAAIAGRRFDRRLRP